MQGKLVEELSEKPCCTVPHMIMKLDSLVRFVSGYGQDFNYYHRVVFSFLLFNFSLCSRYPFRIWVEISAAAYRYICIEQKCRRWYTLRIWVVVNGICFVLLWAFKIELFLSYTLVNRNFLMTCVLHENHAAMI